MDISSIKASGADVEITHPSTYEPIGLTITLRPSTSPECKAVERDQTADTLRSRGKSMTPAKLDSFVLDKLVAATAAWKFEKDTTIDGQQPDCTAANVRSVYKKYPWIMGQVQDAYNDEARFFGADESTTV